MSKIRVHDEKPWEPTMDSLPVFNPFVSPVEHLGDLKVPVAAEDDADLPATAAEGAAGDSAQAAGPGDGAPVAAAKIP